MKIKAELTFPSELKEEPIICDLCKKFDIIVNIVEASFSTDTGWAILVIKGQDQEIKKALDYLKGNGVEVKEIQESA
jgi:ABC-type methionine transport system ATPase subunit